MKNRLKLIAILIVIFSSITNRVSASSLPSDSIKFVLDGKILKSHNGTDSKCKVELFYENTVIDSSNIKMNRAFRFNLKQNVWYTLRVTKEGYLPLLISFNTKVKDNVKIKENTFYFETHLIHSEDAKYMNQEFIDFPIGLVELNPKNGKFETKEEFTNNYLTIIKNKASFDGIAKTNNTKGRNHNY